MLGDSSRRVFEHVVQRIRIDIAQGRIKPGDRLPPDRMLAGEFGVGRGSIREAIRALELFELVRVKRGRGGGVFFTEHCADLARTSFIRLTAQSTLADTLEFRRAIEPKAAALAASRATEAEIARLRGSIRMMEEDIRSASRFVESNRIFHETIARATRNPYFEECIPQFLARAEVVSAAGSSETIERSITKFFHSRIVEAIARRDAGAAEFWMSEHLSQIVEDVAYGKALSGTTAAESR